MQKLLFCTAVAGLIAGAGTSVSAAPSAQTQRQAIFACMNSLGITGEVVIETYWQSTTLFGRGTSTVVAQPTAQVSAADATRINDCAARAVGAPAPQPAVITQAPVPVTDQSYGEKLGTGAAVGTHQLAAHACPPNFSGMYRGTLYCQNGRLLH